MKESQDDIAKRVMDEIKKDHVTMYPHGYFIAAAVFLTVGAIGLLTATSFLTNVVLFNFRSRNPLHPLWREHFGWGYVISHLPWVAIILAIVGIWAGLKLLHHFAPLYRRRTSELVFGMLIIAVVGGVILDYVGVNEGLHRRQGMIRIYSFRDNDERWLGGEITDISSDKSVFSLKTPQEDIWKIFIDQGLNKAPLTQKLQVGMTVHVIAQCEEDYVCHARAIGIGALIPPPEVAPGGDGPTIIIRSQFIE